MRKLVSILLALAVAVSLLVVPMVSADGAPTIDGLIDVDEWDAYYLGTSVTDWSGGMSVDVYGFADDTFLYAAYVADTSQPGWATTTSMCIPCNFNYWTPSTAEWPDEGYTVLGFGGDGIGQTDGSDWNFDSFGGWEIQGDEWADAGIEYYVGDPCYNALPNPNVAEVKVPLSLLTYAGTDNIIGLSGQYWQYVFAEPFYVELPPNTTVGLTAETPEITAISVSPTDIDFGTVTPGTPKAGDDITVENIGGVTVDVDATVNPVTGVFKYLQLGVAPGVPKYSPAYSGFWDNIISSLDPSVSRTIVNQLAAPLTYSGKGIETATLVFEATAV